jgi:predicted esterase
MTGSGPHQDQTVFTVGKPVHEASAAMILLHGRGAPAQSMFWLAQELAHPQFTYLAPQAQGNTWYPRSFLHPLESNEPWLSSALAAVGAVVAQLTQDGIPTSRIVLVGFSQGACLASEYVARNATRYGGLIVFSGGLIGPDSTPRDYPGSLHGTPVFLGCSDSDIHVPLARVQETTDVLEQLGAVVTERIYPQMAHTVIPDEIEHARRIVDSVPVT